MKRILLSVLVLVVTGGVASADHRHRGSWKKHHGPRGGGHVVVSSPRYVVASPRAYTPRPRFVRQPIYVQRPVIRYRYYNYYQRPAVFVENYPARTGYYWVAGQWAWNGGEWIWQAGHYQPDPAYDNYGGYYPSGYSQPGYGYDQGYSQNPSYSQDCDHDNY